MRSIMLFITALLAVLLSGTTLAADNQASNNPDREALEQEMLEARTSLQEAARRLAEVSARLHGEEIREPVVHAVRMMRGPRLGIGISESSDPAGVRVDSVMADSAAAQAGLQAGDVIVAIDGQALDRDKPATRALARKVHQHRREQPLTVRFVRDGREQEVQVTPTAMKQPGLPPELHHRLSELRSLEGVDSGEIERQVERQLTRVRELVGNNSWMRVRLSGMNEGLGQYFGTSEGVLVLEVPADSELPIRSGDVILRVADQAVLSPRDMMRVLHQQRGEDSIAVEILRQGRREQVSIAPGNQPLAFMPLPGYRGQPD